MAKKKKWTNSLIKAYKHWLATGSYSTWRGDRYFKLTDGATGVTRVFESKEVAAKEGWECK